MRRINLIGAFLATALVVATIAVVYAAWGVRQTDAKAAKAEDQAEKLLPYVTAPGYMTPHTIHWIDDDHILYLGGSAEEYEELWSKRLFSVRIWNWRTGEVKDIDRAASEHICYDGEIVRYAIQQGDVFVFREGPLGAMREVSHPKGELIGRAKNERREADHRFYCRTYKLDSYGSEASCRILLRDGDGLLDATGRACREAERQQLARLTQLDKEQQRAGLSRAFEYEQERLSRPVEYFASPTSAPIQLPIAAREVGGSGYGIHYSRFADAYTVQAKKTAKFRPLDDWPNGMAIPFYVIRRGGLVHTHYIRWDARLNGVPADAQLTQAGLILRSTAIRQFPEPGNAGLYLQPDRGILRRVFSAITEEMRVSPNGCYVAVHSVHLPAGYPKNVRGRLHVLDLC